PRRHSFGLMKTLHVLPVACSIGADCLILVSRNRLCTLDGMHECISLQLYAFTLIKPRVFICKVFVYDIL
uniref:Uncharacterized protein n=1 Tax=Aegilops tauschii subsp. strangulata TaxID=200361 RepID=A0A453S810_AEGTS